MITFHVIILERDPEATGRLILNDGAETGKEILNMEIHNGSFPQSVTTNTNELWFKLQYSVPYLSPGSEPTKRCKHMRACVRFLIELTTNYGKTRSSTFSMHRSYQRMLIVII